MSVSSSYRRVFFSIYFVVVFFCAVRTIKYEPITHVIFDLDGLLVDTETLAYESGRELCAKYGKKFNVTIKRKIMGATQLHTAEVIIKDLNLPLAPQDYIDQYHEILEKRLSKVAIMPGVEKLLRHLHKHNISFAIATGSSVEMYLKKTKLYEELFSLSDHITAASSDPEVKLGKPAPDVFLVCAKRFNDQPHPSKCLVFEDSPGGVTAAISAGMQVVMVPDDKFVEKNDPIRKKATLLLKSLKDFRPELFGLPKFEHKRRRKRGFFRKVGRFFKKLLPV